MQNEIYQVRLEEIFEGPMDLLIHLIKKNEVNIYDIPIAIITDQYLEYMDWMKSMNIDVAGDFLLMAATLTQVKSKMLLPVHSDDEDEEDPLSAITRPLLEYLEIKSAAEILGQRKLLGVDTFTRSPKKEIDGLVEQENETIEVGLFELIDAFKNILESISPGDKIDLTADRISVKDRISEIIDIIENSGSVTFGELFSGNPSKDEVIVTFLAILEMIKLSLVRVAQHVQTGIIRLFYV